MRKALFAILGMAAMFAACSQTVSASSNDDEEKASATDSSDSKGAGDGSSGSGSSEDMLDKDCIGEPGKPWDGTTAKEFACGSGTKLSPYIILTAEQLAKLAFIVGANETEYEGKYYKLAADIKLNDGKVIDDKGALVADSSKLHKWTPIGNSSVAFTGNFDGNGHTVSGMFINTTSSHNGLFGNSSGTVQNVTVADSWVTGGKQTGGVVGNISGTANIVGALNQATIVGLGDGVGGVIGNYTFVCCNKTGTVKKVKNYGIVSAIKYVGGVIGSARDIEISEAENYTDVSGTHRIGGIAGNLEHNSKLSDSKNYGNISGNELVGGIIGYYGYCCSKGAAGDIANIKNTGRVEGKEYVGGVIGKNENSSNKNIANSGVVNGRNYVGGLIGYINNSSTINVYNTADVSGTISVGGVIGYNKEGVTNSAYSTGKVDGDSLVGLMIGYNYNTTMADYYYLKQGNQEPFGQNNGGGVATPKTETEMKSADFAKLLGDDFVYDSGLNDGYPVLAWEKE